MTIGAGPVGFGIVRRSTVSNVHRVVVVLRGTQSPWPRVS
jgi:hypothetical protein